MSATRRGAVFGDALSNLLAFTGSAVTREYYINDAGAQVDVLARSVYLRYREALGENIGEIPEGFYPGDYLKPVGQELAAEHGNELLTMPEAKWLPIVRAAALKAMLALIEDDLSALGIRHDVFFSERSLTEGARDEIAETINDLKTRGLIYKGACRRPRARSTRTGKTASSSSSARRNSATIATVRSSSSTGHTPISRATSPITATSSNAALSR